MRSFRFCCSVLLAALALVARSQTFGQAVPSSASASPSVSEQSTFTLTEVKATGFPDAKAEESLRLQIGIRKQPDAAIDHTKVKIQVFFYDTVDDRDIKLTDADVNYEWLTPKHDWTEANPEILSVSYVRPRTRIVSPGTTLPPYLRRPVYAETSGRRYLGYRILLYYDDKLQAAQAEPARLLNLFPAPPVSTALSQEGMEAIGRNDYTSAAKAFQKSADQGDAAGLANLAWLYENGKGVPQDYSKAIELYQQAAATGYAPAQANLAAMYGSGRGVPKDYKKAALLAEKAAAQGIAFAQLGLAAQYEKGLGVPEDLGKAVSLYQRAAEQGYVRAQTHLARLYSEGRGVSKDEKKAAEFYEKAADQGDPNAQTNLGWMYHEGEGVPRDYRKAVELFQKAADQGYAPGQAYLASQYAEGKGVPKDYQKAVELFHKAVNQGQSANAFNDFAWFLATCPDQSQRNGKDAVTYANKACQLSGWKEANFIGTLAAAFAELGDFDAAVKYQQQAIAMGSDYPEKQVMEKALKLYQERKPYRE